jgi:TonB family protein
MKSPAGLLTSGKIMAFLGPSLRRTKVSERPARRAAISVLASLALNALVILAIVKSGAFDFKGPRQPERVELQQLTAAEWNANRSVARGPQPAPAAPLPAMPPPTPQAAPPPEKPPPEQGQVVDVAPSKDNRPPDKPTKFLSDRDNRVAKETRSRFQGTEHFENRAAAPTAGGAAKKPAGDDGSDAESKEAKAGGGAQAKAQEAARQEPTPQAEGDRLAMLDRPRLPSAGPSRSGNGQVEDEGLGAPGPAGEAQEGKKKAGDPRLLPSVDSMSRIAAGPSQDYLDKDIEEGDETALNTRAFRFATFWNRFKDDVASHWQPLAVWTARDPNGTVYGGRGEYLTRLRIVLDGTGAVKRLDVIQSSGLTFLDREAVRAVRAASPFYNVPPSLLDANGEVSFPFGFIVSMNRPVLVRPKRAPGAEE